MWRINLLEFETYEDIVAFVESEKFLDYANKLNPFALTIIADDKVSATLNGREPVFIDTTEISDIDWITTYSVPNTQPDKEETDEQKELLKQLNRIKTIINDKLNEGH